jgi:hypothetical protein
MPVDRFDTLDAVPEDARDAALEMKDGTFVLFREPEAAGEPLKKALADEREKRKAAERNAKEAAEQLREFDLKEKGLLEAKQKWDTEHLNPVKQRLAELETENRTLKLVTPVKDALRKAGVIDPDDAWAVLGNRFDLTDDGKPILKDDPTADLTTWVASTLKGQKPHWFAGTQASGGGTGGMRGVGGAPASNAIDPLKDPVGALSAARDMAAAKG